MSNYKYLRFFWSGYPALVTLMLLMLVMMFGCITAPETLDEKLADAYSKHTAVANTVAYGWETGALSADDDYVIGLLRNAKLTLNAAKLALDAGDPTSAEGKLNLATTVLIELRDYLNRQGVQP